MPIAFKPHIAKYANGRYFFEIPNKDGETLSIYEVTDDVQGWIDRAEETQTALDLAKKCLRVAITGTHDPLCGEVRRAILTIFGPEVDAQLQSGWRYP